MGQRLLQFPFESLASGLRRLRRDDRGIAAIEAAIVLPIMVFFLFGTIETYQYFRAAAILDRAVFSIADGVAMQPKLYEGGPCDETDHLCTYGVIMGDLMQPIDYKDGGYLTIRLFEAQTSGSSVTWKNSTWAKKCEGSTGACGDIAAAPPPDGMPPAQPGDTILVVQGYQTYEPYVISSRFWTGLGGTEVLTATAFYRPRFDDLKTLY